MRGFKSFRRWVVAALLTSALAASSALAQDADARARFLYDEALRAKASGQPAACAERLLQARATLGRDALQIQGPLVECLYGAGRYGEAADAAKLYFTLSTDAESQEYHDVGRILILAEGKLREASDANAAAEAARRAEERARAEQARLNAESAQRAQEVRDLEARRQAERDARQANYAAEAAERRRAGAARRAIELESEISAEQMQGVLWYSLGATAVVGAAGGIGVLTVANGDPALLTLSGAMVAFGAFGAYWCFAESGPGAFRRAESLEQDRLNELARAQSP